MPITLYHGTSDLYLDEILKNGLKEPYLTNSIDLASYYAEVTTDDVSGNEIILEVVVDTDFLRIDENSMSEPVSFDDYTISELEDIVQEEWDKLAELHPKWVTSNNDSSIIHIPDEYYQASLDTVASCWFDGIINPKNIKVLE